jgi:hypothetical protein
MSLPTVMSFHSSAVTPGQIREITAEYFALERARIYRHLFVTRFGLLAIIVAVTSIGFHWLSPFASSFSVALCTVVPLCAWVAELRCESRLTRRLHELRPDAASYEVVPPHG